MRGFVKRNTEGFTIIELLVVIVVIAILAAITIVAYGGITSRASEAAVRAQAKTMQTKTELYKTEKGRYPISKEELAVNPAASWYVSDAPSTYLFGLVGPSAIPSNSLPADADAAKRILILLCHSDTPTNGVNDMQSLLADTPSMVTGLQVWYYNQRTATREYWTIGRAYGGTGTAWSTAYCPQQ